MVYRASRPVFRQFGARADYENLSAGLASGGVPFVRLKSMTPAGTATVVASPRSSSDRAPGRSHPHAA